MMESKRKTSSSGASCDGISLCLYLALLAIFASPSICIKVYGDDFDNIVSTKIFSLDHSTNCDNKIRVSKTIEEGSLLYAEVQPEIKIRFCMYEAAYTVSALEKAMYMTMLSLLRKTPKIHISIKRGKLKKHSAKQKLCFTRYAEEHSQSFIKKLLRCYV